MRLQPTQQDDRFAANHPADAYADGGVSELDVLFAKIAPSPAPRTQIASLASLSPARAPSHAHAHTPTPPPHRTHTHTHAPRSTSKMTVESLFAALGGADLSHPHPPVHSPAQPPGHSPPATPPPPPAPVNRGLALLDSIFASATPPPPPPALPSQSWSPEHRQRPNGAHAQSAPASAALTAGFSFPQPRAPAYLARPRSQGERDEYASSPPHVQHHDPPIFSPTPTSTALPQILNQDVIASLLGLAPSRASSSSAASTSPSTSTSSSASGPAYHQYQHHGIRAHRAGMPSAAAAAAHDARGSRTASELFAAAFASGTYDARRPASTASSRSRRSGSRSGRGCEGDSERSDDGKEDGDADSSSHVAGGRRAGEEGHADRVPYVDEPTPREGRKSAGPAGSDSGYSESSTVLDADADAPLQLQATPASAVRPLLSLGGLQFADGERERTGVDGDVTPRAPVRRGAAGTGHDADWGDVRTSTPPPPGMLSPARTRLLGQLSPAGPQYQVLSSMASTETLKARPTPRAPSVGPAPAPAGPMLSRSQSYPQAQSQAPAPTSAPEPAFEPEAAPVSAPELSRPLVPFAADSQLWPYPRAPLDDRPLDADDAEIVELDFEDTRALSDMEVYRLKVAERERQRGKNVSGEANGDQMNGAHAEAGAKEKGGRKKKGRKERALEKVREREEIEKSWDFPAQEQQPAIAVAAAVPSVSQDALPPPSDPDPAASSISMSEPLVNGTSVQTQSPMTAKPAAIHDHVVVNGSAGKGKGKSTGADVDRDMAREAILVAIASQKPANLRSMERNEFVREVLTLIHVSWLYSGIFMRADFARRLIRVLWIICGTITWLVWSRASALATPMTSPHLRLRCR